jgi:hypothetical protein
VPVAIDYASTADHWIGDDTFLPPFFAAFWGEREMRVQVRYGEAIWGDDPQALLEEAKVWIDSELLDIQAVFRHRENGIERGNQDFVEGVLDSSFEKPPGFHTFASRFSKPTFAHVRHLAAFKQRCFDNS